MNLKPPGDKLIVKVLKKEEKKTKSGIIIASAVETENPHDTLKAEVMFAGVNCKYVKNGNIILFEQRWSAPCDVDNTICKVINEANILGVVE